MDSLEGFSRRIEAQFAVARELPVQNSADFEHSMGRFASRLDAFETLARLLMADVVRPRVERLATYFPGAVTSKPGDPYLCTCWFGASDHSPTMAVLQLGIDHDEGLGHMKLVYELRIVPAFLPYEQRDRLVVNFLPEQNGLADRVAAGQAQVDERAIVDWVEGCLVRFVATYLRLQACGSPTQNAATVDPVCGMLINKADAKGLQEFKGHRYYFCSDQCCRLFAGTPERFAQIVLQ